jgi:Flp pilus assembly pilin Flp
MREVWRPSEYAIMLTLNIIGLIIVLTAIGDELVARFTNIQTALEDAAL